MSKILVKTKKNRSHSTRPVAKMCGSKSWDDLFFVNPYFSVSEGRKHTQTHKNASSFPCVLDGDVRRKRRNRWKSPTKIAKCASLLKPNKSEAKLNFDAMKSRNKQHTGVAFSSFVGQEELDVYS